MLVSVKLTLSKEVYDAYEAEGPLEKVLSDRLAACVSHSAKKPLYLNDADRQKLEKLLHRNFSTAADLIASIEKLSAASVGGVDIALDPVLLTRLKTRCFGLPFEQFLAERVRAGLEEFTGMR